MCLSTLFSELTRGWWFPTAIAAPHAKLTPLAPVCLYIKEGHVMEYVELPETKRLVSFFFGPGEFVVRCDVQKSVLERLDKVTSIPFTHEQIMYLLRKYPECRFVYREMRRRYEQKAEDRLGMLQNMTDAQNFIYLKDHQPWVLELAKLRDIASYLMMPEGTVKRYMDGLSGG